MPLLLLAEKRKVAFLTGMQLCSALRVSFCFV